MSAHQSVSQVSTQRHFYQTTSSTLHTLLGCSDPRSIYIHTNFMFSWARAPCRRWFDPRRSKALTLGSKRQTVGQNAETNTELKALSSRSFPLDDGQKLDDVNFMTHGLNSIYIILDILFVTGVPLRLYHVVYPFTSAFIYGIFTLIYDLADGASPNLSLKFSFWNQRWKTAFFNANSTDMTLRSWDKGQCQHCSSNEIFIGLILARNTKSFGSVASTCPIPCHLTGTNALDKEYIYKVLDWSEDPGKAVLYFLLTVFVGLPVIWLVLFVLFRIRLLIFSWCCASREDHVV